MLHLDDDIYEIYIGGGLYTFFSYGYFKKHINSQFVDLIDLYYDSSFKEICLVVKIKKGF